MGRALIFLVGCFVAACAALPVALNTYRPPHAPYQLAWTIGDCTVTTDLHGDFAPDLEHPGRSPDDMRKGATTYSDDCSQDMMTA